MNAPDDLQARLNRLNATVEADKAKRLEERKAKWERIQAADPGLAELLTALNAAFGRPAGVVVRIDGERVL